MTQKRLTLDEVAVLSGEELLLLHGTSVQQQLIDLMIAAVRRGATDETTAIDLRAQEVNAVLNCRLSAWMRAVTASPDHSG